MQRDGIKGGGANHKKRMGTSYSSVQDANRAADEAVREWQKIELLFTKALEETGNAVAAMSVVETEFGKKNPSISHRGLVNVFKDFLRWIKRIFTGKSADVKREQMLDSAVVRMEQLITALQTAAAKTDSKAFKQIATKLQRLEKDLESLHTAAVLEQPPKKMVKETTLCHFGVDYCVAPPPFLVEPPAALAVYKSFLNPASAELGLSPATPRERRLYAKNVVDAVGPYWARQLGMRLCRRADAAAVGEALMICASHCF